MAQTPQRRPTRPSQAAPGGGAKGGVRNPDVERALALRDVMQHAVKVEKEFKRKVPVKRTRVAAVFATLVCIPLLAFSVYSWVARPEFIWGASEASIPPAEQEADMRFAMYLLAQRIEAYRETEGTYPSSLGALEDRIEGVTYALFDDAVFELRITQNGKIITFRSDESPDVFLGNSLAIIQGGK